MGAVVTHVYLENRRFFILLARSTYTITTSNKHVFCVCLWSRENANATSHLCLALCIMALAVVKYIYNCNPSCSNEQKNTHHTDWWRWRAFRCWRRCGGAHYSWCMVFCYIRCKTAHLGLLCKIALHIFHVNLWRKKRYSQFSNYIWVNHAQIKSIL